mmetsp:Transcript_55908/g.120319  ORF Transcript_55908/g.120319 Transcript_55908/m.120319 type:complete len:168 (+) Transcript_55908:2-505(+)
MQEKLFKDHATSKYNQMMYINGLSACVSFITLTSSHSLIPVLVFCGTNHRFVADTLLLSVSSVASQFFIYSQVKEFGALVFAATMNVRQVVSILISYVTYHHSITLWQILGLAIVFAALMYKSLAALITSAQPSPEKAPLLAKTAESAPLDAKNTASESPYETTPQV